MASTHTLLETFSTLTGGKLRFRVDADVAARLIAESVVPRVSAVMLTVDEVIEALRNARDHSVRGGGVYDYMHLVAARKANATVLYTLNLADFQHLQRTGDPEIRRP